MAYDKELLKEKAIDAVVVQQKTNGKERGQKHEILPSDSR